MIGWKLRIFCKLRNFGPVLIFLHQSLTLYLPVVQLVCRVRKEVPRIQCGSTSLAIQPLQLEDLIEVHQNTKMEGEENRIKATKISVKFKIGFRILDSVEYLRAGSIY